MRLLVKKIKKNETTIMETKRLQILATEIFKTVNDINSSYIKNIFTPKINEKVQPHDIVVRHLSK